MRITRRDVVVMRDLALSHCLTRDQLLSLDHFGSITRVNTRMRELVRHNFAKRLSVPYFGQSIYTLGKVGVEVVGERIARLVRRRTESPRFLQHALAVTDVRITLLGKLGGNWRFEQQLWRRLPSADDCEIRPDGLLLASSPVFVEVDLGHVAPSKFRAKLDGYQELAASGVCSDFYGFSTFRLLTITTGKTRARHLRQLTPSGARFEHRIETFEDIGVTTTASWS